MNHPNLRGSKPSAQIESTAQRARLQEPTCSRCGSKQNEYRSLAEVAQELHIGRTTVYELVVLRQEIPYIRISERVIRVRHRDVEAYLAGRRHGDKAAS